MGYVTHSWEPGDGALRTEAGLGAGQKALSESSSYSWGWRGRERGEVPLSGIDLVLPPVGDLLGGWWGIGTGKGDFLIMSFLIQMRS